MTDGHKLQHLRSYPKCVRRFYNLTFPQRRKVLEWMEDTSEKGILKVIRKVKREIKE